MSYFALGCPAPGGTPAPHRCGVTSQAGGRGGALQAGLAATRTPSVTGSAGAGASTGDCLQGVCGRCVCVCVCVCSFHRCASPHGIAAAWPAAGSHASANAQVESYASTHARRPLLLISSHAAAPAPGRGGSRQASALKRRTHRRAQSTAGIAGAVWQPGAASANAKVGSPTLYTGTRGPLLGPRWLLRRVMQTRATATRATATRATATARGVALHHTAVRLGSRHVEYPRTQCLAVHNCIASLVEQP